MEDRWPPISRRATTMLLSRFSSWDTVRGWGRGRQWKSARNAGLVVGNGVAVQPVMFQLGGSSFALKHFLFNSSVISEWHSVAPGAAGAGLTCPVKCSFCATSTKVGDAACKLMRKGEW